MTKSKQPFQSVAPGGSISSLTSVRAGAMAAEIAKIPKSVWTWLPLPRIGLEAIALPISGSAIGLSTSIAFIVALAKFARGGAGRAIFVQKC